MRFKAKPMNKTTAAFILIAVIFFSAGIGVGILISGELKGVNPKYSEPNTFEAGWEAAKKKVENSGAAPAVKGETKTIKGRITEVKPDRIIISARLLNPLDDEKLKTRTVIIGGGTKIIIREEKSGKTIRKEHNEYNKKMEEFRQGKGEMPKVPEIYIERSGSIDDLKSGQIITVESKENIRQAAEFTASKILVR